MSAHEDLSGTARRNSTNTVGDADVLHFKRSVHGFSVNFNSVVS